MPNNYTVRLAGRGKSPNKARQVIFSCILLKVIIRLFSFNLEFILFALVCFSKSSNFDGFWKTYSCDLYTRANKFQIEREKSYGSLRKYAGNFTILRAVSACPVCSNEVKWYERNEWIQTFHDWVINFHDFLIRPFISTKKVQFKSFFLLFLYGWLEVIWLITFDFCARKKHFTCVVYILTLMRWGNIFWIDTISH